MDICIRLFKTVTGPVLEVLGIGPSPTKTVNFCIARLRSDSMIKLFFPSFPTENNDPEALLLTPRQIFVILIVVCK